MMKLLKQFWGWCVFLITMAVVGVICFVAFTFLRGEAEKEMDRHELVETPAMVTRVLTVKSKEDKSATGQKTEVRLPNGELWELDGKLGVHGDHIKVKVPRYVLTEGKEGRDESKLGKE